MKINENGVVNTSKPGSSKVYETSRADGASAAAGYGRTSTPASGDDGIDLQSQASLLAKAQTAGASDRSANVERLKALVQSGQYQVDPVALSRSIVSAAFNGN